MNVRKRVTWKLKKNNLSRSVGGNIVVTAILVVVAMFMGVPLVYAFVSSFKPFEEIFLFPPRLFVRRPTLDNFTNLFILSSNLWVPFSRYIFNSVFVSVTGTTLHVLFASAAAYPLAKHDFPGKKLIFNVIIAALLFTGYVTYIPQYIIMAQLGFINTYFALIFPPLGAALGLFLMRQFMDTIPMSLEEAAELDGCNPWQVIIHVIAPLSKTAIATLVTLGFIGAWNGFLFPLIFTVSESMRPLTVGLATFAIYLYFQRYFVKGIALGGMKL